MLRPLLLPLKLYGNNGLYCARQNFFFSWTQASQGTLEQTTKIRSSCHRLTCVSQKSKSKSLSMNQTAVTKPGMIKNRSNVTSFANADPDSMRCLIPHAHIFGSVSKAPLGKRNRSCSICMFFHAFWLSCLCLQVFYGRLPPPQVVYRSTPIGINKW